MFRLKKWYFDVVSAEGTAFVGYAAHLTWGPLKGGYRATLLCRPGSAPIDTHTIRHSPDPKRLPDGAISWECEDLGLSGRWMPTSSPIQRRLFESPSGAAEWNCIAPAAEVALRLGAESLEGLGYAESLVLSAPPWRLGSGDLLWGRFVAAGASLIWVHWKGTDNPPLVLVNGEEKPGATVSSDGIHLPGDGGQLHLGPKRVLREGLVLDILAAMPPLVRRISGGLDRVVERKWLSPGEWHRTGADPIKGWAIHEVVEWPNP